MKTPQPGILAALPAQARFISFLLGGDTSRLPDTLRALRGEVDGLATVAGFGLPLFDALGRVLPGLTAGPVVPGSLVEIPAQPFALWLWLRGSDRGELMQRERRLTQLLAPALVRQHSVDAFKHDTGRDLTGYEDGTENPQDDAALAAAIVSAEAAVAAGDPHLAGSSYVAVQQWLHDMDAFDAMGGEAQDHAIGRRRSDNEELDDAPETAHVKRTAQEDFEPEAFVLRRSMPWIAGHHVGFYFVAFGCSLYAFEAQLRRMSGAEDGLVDGLFRFTRPINGAYAWCPGLADDGRLDLAPLGL